MFLFRTIIRRSSQWIASSVVPRLLMLVILTAARLKVAEKRLPEKLKTIRERLGLTPDEIALRVGAKTGAEILAYENDEDDLLVTVLFGYAKLAGCPIDNLLYDDLLK